MFCQYDLRGSPSDVCPECGTRQPPGGFDLAIIHASVDSDRTRRRKRIAVVVCIACIGGLLAFGLMDSGNICCMSVVAWIIAAMIISGLAARDRAQGQEVMRLLFDHQGIHEIRSQRRPRRLFDWQRPYRYRVDREKRGRWSLRVHVPFWSLRPRPGVADATFTFNGSRRDAARVRRFIKRAIGDHRRGRIRRPKSA